MFKFTDLRDAFENFVASAFHKGIALLEPLAHAVGHAATPVVEAALINAGRAVIEANKNGTAHGSHEMIQVVVGSLKSEVPTLTAAVSTALAASVVQLHAGADAQSANAPLNVPPAQ